jgi:DNA-binding NarL/FixJ family response regulator
MIRILLADDHAIVRRGLRQIILEDLGQAVVGEVATGQGVLDSVRKENWDAIVLDISLPDKNGLDVLKEVKALRPSLPVLIFSTGLEDQYAVRALKAGAAGYMAKELAEEELVAALKKVLKGGIYVSPSLAERLAGDVLGKADSAPHHALSDREIEVLRLLAKGKTVSDIADQLSLSVTTISTYRARLLEKLQLKSTAALIRYALDNKLGD